MRVFGHALLTVVPLLVACRSAPDSATVSYLVTMNLEAVGILPGGPESTAEVRASLCGGVGVGGHPWRMKVRRVKVVGAAGEDTVVEVGGVCVSDDELSQRAFGGTVRARVTARDSTTFSRMWRRANTQRSWWLTALVLEKSDAPGPIESASAGVKSRAAPRLGCPDSVEDALRTLGGGQTPMSSCDLADPRPCWYGEIGCRCTAAGALPRWQCGKAGCPAPRPEVDAPCDTPLARCLEPAEAGPTRTALECRSEKWRRVTLE